MRHTDLPAHTGRSPRFRPRQREQVGALHGDNCVHPADLAILAVRVVRPVVACRIRNEVVDSIGSHVSPEPWSALAETESQVSGLSL